MTKIVSVLLQKGGTGKSSSTFTLSYELAKRGLKVLMVDLDPQANLTMLAGIQRPDKLEKTMADVLFSYTQKERIGIEECMLKINENLFLAPSVIDMSSLDLVLNQIMSREYLLKRILEPVEHSFDLIMIDCQPSLGLLPINALACSSDLLVPCCAEYLSYRGLDLLEDTVRRVRENLNANLNMYGVIATKVENTLHNKEILELLGERYNLLGVIPKNVKLMDSIYSKAGSIVDSDPDAKASVAYKLVADKMWHDFGFDKKELKEDK